MPHIGPKAKEPTAEEKAAADAQAQADAEAETARIAAEDEAAAKGDPAAVAAKKKRDDAAAALAAKPGAKKDDAPAADDDAAAGDDDFTAPEGVNERGTKRWNKLVTRTKKAEALAQHAVGVANEWDRVMRATGAPPEAIAGAFEIIRLMHSPKDEDRRKALERIDAQRITIARYIGEEVPGFDILADHPDLQKDVDGMTLPRERAVEIAKGRNLKKRQEDQAAALATEHDKTSRREVLVSDAKKALAGRQAELEGKDLDFAAKYHYMMGAGIFQDIADNFTPDKWLERFNVEYARIKPEMLKAKAPAPKVDPKTGKPVVVGGDPLRSGTGAGSGKPGAPKDMLDAVERSLEST